MKTMIVNIDEPGERAWDGSPKTFEIKELVRCKDCIWFHKPDAETKKSCKCNYHGCVTEEDRYCWWGENDA